MMLICSTRLLSIIRCVAVFARIAVIRGTRIQATRTPTGPNRPADEFPFVGILLWITSGTRPPDHVSIASRFISPLNVSIPSHFWAQDVSIASRFSRRAWRGPVR